MIPKYNHCYYNNHHHHNNHHLSTPQIKLYMKTDGQCLRTYSSPVTTSSSTNEMSLNFKLDPTHPPDMLLVLLMQNTNVCVVFFCSLFFVVFMLSSLINKKKQKNEEPKKTKGCVWLFVCVCVLWGAIV